MKKYIQHLIEDIKNAHRDKSNIAIVDEESIEETMEEVEGYLNFDPDEHPPFSDVCGLFSEQFPPAESLSTIEIEVVLEAYYEMLNTYNVHIYSPDNIPNVLLYNLIPSVLDNPLLVVDHGTVELDLCNYDIPNCIFGEYCTCMLEEKEMDKNLIVAQTILTDIRNALQANYRPIVDVFSYEISDKITSDDLKISMFLAKGLELPLLEDFQAIDILYKLNPLLLDVFSSDIELSNSFQDPDWGYYNLRTFLGLNASVDQNFHFMVAPFHIEKERIELGPAPIYTPEELMEKLEQDDILPF
ncbi:MAG: hypothetical protein V3V14_02830 [Saprospiraceae bacterium]